MKWYWLICLSLLLTGCGSFQQLWLGCFPQTNPQNVKISDQWEECFDHTPFEVNGTGNNPHKISHSVYCLGKDKTKRPIILLHEISGLTPGTLYYAEELSDEFTVYVPLLFGEKGQSSDRSTVVAFLNILFGNEWDGGSQLDSSTPIVAWLQQLTSKIEGIHDPGHGIRIIGNCLTGILPLIAFDDHSDDREKVLVLAQPSLPLKVFSWYSPADKSSLGVTETELLSHSQVEPHMV